MLAQPRGPDVGSSSGTSSPGEDLEANWLPAPASGDFSLYLRAYWPKPAMLDGTWTPPPVRRVS